MTYTQEQLMAVEKSRTDLSVVLDPRNGRTDNGCIVVHEKVIAAALECLQAITATKPAQQPLPNQRSNHD